MPQPTCKCIIRPLFPQPISRSAGAISRSLACERPLLSPWVIKTDMTTSLASALPVGQSPCCTDSVSVLNKLFFLFTPFESGDSSSLRAHTKKISRLATQKLLSSRHVVPTTGNQASCHVESTSYHLLISPTALQPKCHSYNEYRPLPGLARLLF